MKLDELLADIRAATGFDPVKNGKGWKCLCPAHADANPSLSVGEGEDHRLLIHCYAGCSPAAIVAALGLKLADIMPPEPDGQHRKGKLGTVEAVYTYRDETGQAVFEVVRYRDPKDFRQRKADGTWSMKGVHRVPYNLPAVQQAPDTEWVYICEGEKDCDTMAAHGMVASCNPGGALKWRAEYNRHFRGKLVCIVADKDEPGRRHAEDVARHLYGTAATVRIIEVPDHAF